MKKYRLILTENPGEVDSTVLIDIVTNSEPIASVWSKKLCYIWEDSDGNACMPNEDGSTEFLDDSHEDVCYLLDFMVLDADEDTGDVIVIDIEEDMPKFEYCAFKITILLADVEEDTE